MLGIVVSHADAASMHIGEHLRSLRDWETSGDETRPDDEGGGTVYQIDSVELREFEALHLDIENVAAAFDDPDLLVFASKHAGETDELLTAHHTGNFGVAEYGGEDGQFARACPGAHKAVVSALQRHAPPDYEVGMECTHHGPTAVGVPSMFVEVGSAEPQWEDPDAAEAAARAILDLADEPADRPRENGTRRHLLGVGGGHYAPRFERVVRETDWAVGHIAANWSLDALAEWADTDAERDAVLERALAASAADYASWRGTGRTSRQLSSRWATVSSVRRSFGRRPVSIWASSRGSKTLSGQSTTVSGSESLRRIRRGMDRNRPPERAYFRRARRR